MLAAAGHRVRLLGAWNGERLDVLVVLHARKSVTSALAYRRAHPHGRLVVVLTGTDVYGHLERSARAMRALDAADAIVTLQALAAKRLVAVHRRKCVAIVQSAPRTHAAKRRRRDGVLKVAVLGHLRREKDPLRAARALRELRGVRIEVVQAGAALTPAYARAAQRLAAREPRYRWLGDLTHAGALRLLAQTDVLVLSSRMEGGANILSEAIATGTAVLASQIDGNVGILGPAYPGYFRVGDTRGCAALLRRCHDQPAFLRELRARVRAKRALVRPEREQALLLGVVGGAAMQRTSR